MEESSNRESNSKSNHGVAKDSSSVEFAMNGFSKIEPDQELVQEMDLRQHIASPQQNTEQLSERMPKESVACNVFDEMSNMAMGLNHLVTSINSEIEANCTLETSSRRQSVDRNILGKPPEASDRESLLSSIEKQESDNEMQIQKQEIVPSVIVQVVIKEQSQELEAWSPEVDKNMEETQLPDTSSKVISVEAVVSDVVACEKMGKLVKESFDSIEILWEEFKVHSFEFLADSSAHDVFDKMPVRSFNDTKSSIQLSNVHLQWGNCVFDPGIIGSSKQVEMPTTEFITWTSSVQPNHLCSLKENWIFDPGDFIVVEQKCSYSGKAKADRVFMPYDRGKFSLMFDDEKQSKLTIGEKMVMQLSNKLDGLFTAEFSVYFSRIGATSGADFAEQRSQWDPGGIIKVLDGDTENDSALCTCNLRCRENLLQLTLETSGATIEQRWQWDPGGEVVLFGHEWIKKLNDLVVLVALH